MCKIQHNQLPLVNSNKDINNNDKFTILINNWQRDTCLIKLVGHYLSCHDDVNIAQIRIIWSDPNNDIPKYLRDLQSTLTPNKLIFDEYRDDKLTNRFKYNSEWMTNAIFQTDDDIIYSCDLLAATFKLWKLIPAYMIGFAPRQSQIEYTPQYINSFINIKPKLFYPWDKSFDSCRYSLMFPTLVRINKQREFCIETKTQIFDVSCDCYMKESDDEDFLEDILEKDNTSRMSVGI